MSKRVQIFDKPITLTSIKEIDGFLKEVLTKTGGWFDAKSLWEVENPYDVFRRMNELNLRVYTYKKKEKTSFSVISAPPETLLEDYIYVCQYNVDNKDDNYLQDLYISHWLNKQCTFSKVGPHNVCIIVNKNRTLKAFPGDFIIKQGYDDSIIAIINKKDLEKNYVKIG